MKRLSVCLIVVPFLGFTGPCMQPSPPRQIETGTAEPIEPMIPEVSEPEPVIPPPPPPPLPPAPPPPLPPPPTPEPEPVITEPPLYQFSCSYFPPLPLEPSPGAEIVRVLTENEATHFWQRSNCIGFSLNDLGEISGCERLLAGTYTNALDQYYSVFKFPLTGLPDADKAENVTLNFYPIEGSVFFVVTLSLDVRPLIADWWRDCSSETEPWRPLCDYEMPPTETNETINWELGSDEQNYYLLSLELTELYRDWQNGTRINYGLMLGEMGGLFNFFILAGPEYPDPSYRPYLRFTTKPTEPTLKFPLDGVYDRSRITGYDFGKWWEEGYCLDGKTPLRHTGIDLHALPEDPVYAVSDGEVMYALPSDKWGGYVVLEHGGEWTSTYTHVIPMVSEFTEGIRTEVTRGEQIATIAFGNTNFKPHLHFQVRLATFTSGKLVTRIGRLPEKSCQVKNSPFQPENDPAFPEKFLDPKCLDWER